MQTILFDGKPYVILPKAEYDRLNTLAKAADLPPLPKADSEGNYPAVEYASASLARKIIKARAAAGMTQRELALRAGIRVETLCRIETGKHVPSIPTVEKIDRVLKAAAETRQTEADTSAKRPRRTRKKTSGER